jgi:hypothetical protein
LPEEEVTSKFRGAFNLRYTRKNTADNLLVQWTTVSLDKAHALALAKICYNLTQTDRCALAARH